MTRESDEYVDLRKRVSVGHQAGADAFISYIMMQWKIVPLVDLRLIICTVIRKFCFLCA